MKPTLSIKRQEIDGVKSVDFYLILDNDVVGSARIAYPYDPMPVLRSGFVDECRRKQGYWKMLFNARMFWLQASNKKAEYVYLYVDPDNTMRKVYERMGFEYTGEKNEENNCLWMRRKIHKQ